MTSLPNSLRCRPGHNARHFMYTASCVKTTLAASPLCKNDTTEKTRVSWNWDEFFGCLLNIFRLAKSSDRVLELIYLKMEVSVLEPCDVIRVTVTHFKCEWNIFRFDKMEVNAFEILLFDVAFMWHVMKGKGPTNTFVMISNRKDPLVSIVYGKIF